MFVVKVIACQNKTMHQHSALALGHENAWLHIKAHGSHDLDVRNIDADGNTTPMWNPVISVAPVPWGMIVTITYTHVNHKTFVRSADMAVRFSVNACGTNSIITFRMCMLDDSRCHIHKRYTCKNVARRVRVCFKNRNNKRNKLLFIDIYSIWLL